MLDYRLMLNPSHCEPVNYDFFGGVFNQHLERRGTEAKSAVVTVCHLTGCEGICQSSVEVQSLTGMLWKANAVLLKR